MREVTWQERAEVDVAMERLSRAVDMRNWAEFYVRAEQEAVQRLCARLGIPTHVRHDGSVQVPDGFPMVRRAVTP